LLLTNFGVDNFVRNVHWCGSNSTHAAELTLPLITAAARDSQT